MKAEDKINPFPQSVKFDPNPHLIKLQGKDYLQVAWRLVWLRTEHPDAQIRTHCSYADDKIARFMCEITLPSGACATGHGSETPGDFRDYYEKAETKAIGRACAILGFGSQFAPELHEGERIVDSPVQRNSAPPAERRPQSTPLQQVASAQQRPQPGPGAMTEAQGRRLFVVSKNQNLTEDDVRGQVFLNYGKHHIHEMTKGEASRLMDRIEVGDLEQGPVPSPPRVDPQEANQQGALNVPDWVDQAPPVESFHHR